MMNAASYALRALQRDFEGVAAEAGVESEDDVQGLIDEVRAGQRG